MDLACAFYQSSLLFAASDLGVFACIERVGPADAAAVAAACGLNARGGRLLLDGCAAIGLLTKDGSGRYANAPDVAAFLVPGKPGDLSQAIRYNRDVFAAWGRLPELARTGLPVEKPEMHLGDDPARTRAFAMAMYGRAMGIGRAVVPQLDLSGVRRVLDVGGGPGAYAMLIAEAAPQACCTTLDLPAISAVARELVAARGLAGRVQCVAGDYHTADFTGGNDLVTLFGMLHQESPESIVDILRRAHAALNPGGRVCILDMMTDATRCRPAFSALFAVNMALTTQNGWVFSDREILDWLAEAGFREATCKPLPPPMPHWLATARK